MQMQLHHSIISLGAMKGLRQCCVLSKTNRIMARVGTRQLSSKNSIFSLKDIQQKVSVGIEKLKGSLIQVMAQRMSDKDKLALSNHWHEKLSDGPDKVDATIVQAAETEVKKILPIPNFNFSTTTEDKQLFHPLLGEVIADLGYKRLYLTNVKSLAMTPVWKRQRILRPERSALIAKEKVRNKLGSSMCGTITLFMDKTTKEIGILDGQHRAGALLILSQRGMLAFTMECCCVT